MTAHTNSLVYEGMVVWVLFGVCFGGLVIVGFLVLRLYRLLGELIPSENQKTSVLESFQALNRSFAEMNKREQTLNKNITEFRLENLKHTQKLALLRYNPYGDTGGEQSFSLVLLDGKDNGVVLTSLHTRAGTRIYAKQINKSKSELSLSKEEDQTLKQALELTGD